MTFIKPMTIAKFTDADGMEATVAQVGTAQFRVTFRDTDAGQTVEVRTYAGLDSALAYARKLVAAN